MATSALLATPGAGTRTRVGGFPSMQAALASLRVSDAERAVICGGSAARLLGLQT